jgi:pimeloyl-ACP methyl ester carboxylesterase
MNSSVTDTVETVIKPTIVFIHGAWMNSRCWEQWMQWFQAQGYSCVAPDWPFKDKSVEELQQNPDTRLATVGVQEIVEHYERIIDQLPGPAILIGHSFGGLFVQMLLDRGAGNAGIAIDPAPSKTILPFAPSVLRAFWWILAKPFGWKRVLHISQKRFGYAFMHTRPQAELEAAYKRYVIPETGKIFFEGATALLNDRTKINFANSQRGPLLFIAGTEDHVCPIGQVHSAYVKSQRSGTKTDYLVFKGRDHWIINEPGWEEVAAQTEQWIRSVGNVV